MTVVNTETGEITETPLTAMEQSALTHAEAKIERGLSSFIEVGEALSEVRDSRLYREEFSTFEAYCRDRWAITDRRARQMIDASTIVDSLPTGTIVPVSESQARELRGLEPEQAAVAMREADRATGGHPTAAAIRVARNQLPARHAPPTPSAPTVEQAVAEFPDLSYYADNGPARHVLDMAGDLRVFRQRGELDMRLDNLRRSIALDRAKRDGTYRPGTTAVMGDDGEYHMAPLPTPTTTTRTCPTCSGRGVIEE